MTTPYSDVAAQLQQQCEAGLARATAAFTQAFDEPWDLQLGTTQSWSGDSLPPEWDSSGLVFVFQSGEADAVVLLSDASGLVPPWCSQLDENGRAKLLTLAQELGAAISPVPEATPEFTAGRVKNLGEALARAAPAPNSVVLPLIVRMGEKIGQVWVVWPTAKGEAMLSNEQLLAGNRKLGTKRPAAPDTAAASPPVPAKPPIRRYHDFEEGIDVLPSYSRSLLRIRVPVTVTLAAAKQSLNAILNIGSGSIIHFNKSCEDTLTLEVAGHKVAVGETVKVGDKFGLWITSMILPDERFWIISSRQPATRAK